MMPATSAAVSTKPLARIDRVIFPTDFSPCAQAALPYACVLAEQNKATLHLLNVVGSPIPSGPLGVPYMEPGMEEEVARRDLAKLTENQMVQTVRHETSIHRGTIWDTVCQIAHEQHGSAVIVMGTHGRKGVRQLILGSVAEQVFRRSDCPVMTIGPGAGRAGPTNGRFGTILLALDLSPASNDLVEWGHMLAVQNRSRLIYFHAVQENAEAAIGIPNYVEETANSARKRLSALLQKDVPWCDISIKIGEPDEKIVETAADRNADLIIIGAHHGATFAAHSPWRCAHEVVCAAPCPVLTISH